MRRAEMLAELMRLYATVSVTGTHGKTTTTSLIAHIFNVAGLDPTVITGGIINEWGSNARLGDGKWMIVEADESDGTFIKMPTQIGVVTNIDPEHLDYFKTVENMHREFETFFRNIPFYGLAVTCMDHPVVAEMIERLELRRDGRRLLTYGMTAGADLVLKSARVDGSVTIFDADLGARVAAGRARSGAGACRSPATTTRSTRWRPLPRRARPASATTSYARRWLLSPASSGASSSPAPGTAWRSTTTTAITPSRSPPC